MGFSVKAKATTLFCALFLLGVLSMLLVGCADKKSEAGDLMAEGSYQEALEIYASLEQDEEVAKAMSECRYFLRLPEAGGRGYV
ncbi:MAG: hypothetical protein ACLTQI_08085 [Slackia sp.]